MRGRRNPQLTMLAFIDLEERVPTAHPLRTIKRLADEALTDLSSVFDRMVVARIATMLYGFRWALILG